MPTGTPAVLVTFDPGGRSPLARKMRWHENCLPLVGVLKNIKTRKAE